MKHHFEIFLHFNVEREGETFMSQQTADGKSRKHEEAEIMNWQKKYWKSNK
jgi:hypothetical protein